MAARDAEGRANVVHPDPLFSVIIPTYNRADLIVRAVESVTFQDYGSFEVIVMDDGSNDNTEEVIGELPDPRVRYHKLERSGAARARNVGASLARGTLLVFLDSDDEALPSWLQTMAAFYSSEIDLISTDSWSLKASGKTRLGSKEIGYPGSELRTRLLSGSYAITASLFMDLGGFEESLPAAQHTDLGLRIVSRLSEQPLKSVHINVPLVVHHRDMPHSIRHNDRAVLDGTEFIIDRHSSILGRAPRRLADYHSVAGIAAIRLGEMKTARRHLLESVRTNPSNPKRWLRLTAALLPWGGSLWHGRRNPQADPGQVSI